MSLVKTEKMNYTVKKSLKRSAFPGRMGVQDKKRGGENMEKRVASHFEWKSEDRKILGGGYKS